eukprot:1149173-Pelagomonas_calceolata.AAC.2
MKLSWDTAISFANTLVLLPVAGPDKAEGEHSNSRNRITTSYSTGMVQLATCPFAQMHPGPAAAGSALDGWMDG